MAAKSKIKRELSGVKRDFKILGITQQEIANELGTNRVRLNRLYNVTLIDVELTRRLKVYRDKKLNEATKQIAA